MKREERYESGDRLFKDAVFIRDEVIPKAQDAGRWNIVVFEAYRVSELLIKALFFYAGWSPRQSHELDKVIDDLQRLLEKTKYSIPFVYSLVAKGGNCYAVTFLGNRIRFFKRISNVYTQIGGGHYLPSLTVNDIVTLRIDINGSLLTVKLNNEVILSISDSSITQQPLQLHRTLVKPADSARVEKIKKIVTALRRTREEAFYSERSFSEQEAEEAIAHMMEVIDLSKAFLVEEPLA